MNVKTEQAGGVSIVRVGETRMMYPLLSDFSSAVTGLVDGDLLAIMETLYQEVTARRELERSFEDMVREIHHLIEQMDDGERRTYLAESLFLNTVKYENDKLEAYMRKLSKKK